MLAATEARLMTYWVDGRGVVVAKISQQGAYHPNGGVSAVYIAEVPGEASPCRRYACAKDKVEKYLKANRIVATPRMA